MKLHRLFHKACEKYSLLEDGDRVLVALSGGKDSLTLVRLLAEQSRIYKPRIEVEAAHVVMDNIPYESDHSYLQNFCSQLGIRLHILHSSFDTSTDHRKTRCFLCARKRRQALFSYATENGFNKVALGHHMDDFLVTLLMNITFEGSHSTMKPSMPMEHYPLTVIRPLCLVPEAQIKAYAQKQEYMKQKTPCPYETTTMRTSMEGIFHQLEELNPEARYSMWRSAFAVHSFSLRSSANAEHTSPKRQLLQFQQ